jgi:hypothetical protein
MMADKSGAVVVPWQANHCACKVHHKPNSTERGKKASAFSLTWNGVEYPRVRPGNYQAVCVGWQGPEYVYEYRRWSLRLEFCLFDDGTRVSTFLNFGNGSRPEVPGQRSRFFKEWCLANGGPPKKGETLRLDTFVDPELIYTVRVEDCAINSKGAEKADALVYSRVNEVLKVQRSFP